MSIKNILLTLNFCLLAVSLSSCKDELLLDSTPDYTLSGEPVELTLKVSVPELEVQTRADLGYEELNRVTTLWVRTYSATSGEATSDWQTVSTDVNQAEQDYGPIELTIHTHSGYNYIIAVANVDNNGVTKDKPTVKRKLSELLTEADTWEKFLDIAVVSPTDNEDTYAPETPMPMAGCYTNIISGGPHYSISQWQYENFESYFIPASKSAIVFNDGVIHLRRLVSQINFNIRPVNEDLTVTVNSYKIYNAPKATWLFERSNENGNHLSNFGDSATDDTVNDYYTEVPTFSSQYIDIDESTGVSTFNFWQGENKHTGKATTYFERELAEDYNSELPLFTSLTGKTWTPNDMASYVKISCTIEYTGTLNVNSQGEVVDANGEVVHRVGYADYYVHLGYINDDPTDFNCYRNVKYTYNIEVNGVNDIRVDAFASGELDYPGEAGIVTDLSDANITLDCHYNTFNITLTEEDLASTDSDSGLNAFGFLIATYKSGRQYVFDEDTDFSAVDDRHLYNWIELKKVSDDLNASTLAEYSPSYNLTSEVPGHTMTADETFLITELNDRLRSGLLTPGTYTVFVNEYTYEPMYGETNYGNESSTEGTPNWMTYVNQDPRRFFIKVNQKKSPDGNRIYARSKYGIVQRSMQTYFNTLSSSVLESFRSGLAVERVNETEGLNLTNHFASSSTVDGNGRYNMGLWLTGVEANNTNAVTGGEENRVLWNTRIQPTVAQNIPSVDANRLQGGPSISARTVALPAIVTTTGQNTFSNPQSGTSAIEAMNACLGRNRDNNGNHRIDPEEIRWYLPTIRNYLQLTIGSESLDNPIMNYQDVKQLPFVSNAAWTSAETSDGIKNDYLSRYMFAASNTGEYQNARTLMIMWAMEGTSTSTWSQANEWGGGYTYPWQVRCVRNLGTDLNTLVPDESDYSNDGTKDAYVHDSNARTVEMSYFDYRSIRVNKYSGNGSGVGQMPTHLVTDETYNSVYRKFEYASEDQTYTVSKSFNYNNNTTTITSDSNNEVVNAYAQTIKTYIDSNPCSAMSGTGWRLPNQKEAAIMRNLGVITSGNLMLTCTANYFNTTTGFGGTYVNGQNRFMGMYNTHGSMLTNNNIKGYSIYVRCVRDVD